MSSVPREIEEIQAKAALFAAAACITRLALASVDPAELVRVLERIAQAQAGHVTVHADAAGWKPFDARAQIKVLHRAGDVMSYLLRLAPGATLAPHRHPIDEECVVLEGRLRIGDELLVDAGGFHLAHRDALHATITSDEGATIYLRGAIPHAALAI